jgi:hypothetical protein
MYAPQAAVPAPQPAAQQAAPALLGTEVGDGEGDVTMSDPSTIVQEARRSLATLHSVLAMVKSKDDPAAERLASLCAEQIKAAAVAITKAKPLEQQKEVLEQLVARRQTSYQAACTALLQAQEAARKAKEEFEESSTALQQIATQLEAQSKSDVLVVNECATLLSAVPADKVQLLKAFLESLVQAPAPPAASQVPAVEVKKEDTNPNLNPFVPEALRPCRKSAQRARSVGDRSPGRRSRSPIRGANETLAAAGRRSRSPIPGGMATPLAAAGRRGPSPEPAASASAVFRVDDDLSTPG